MKPFYRFCLFSFLFCFPFFSNAQATVRIYAPFTKIFSPGTPALFGPGVQIELGLGQNKNGTKSRIYVGGSYNIVNLGRLKTHHDSLIYKHYLVNFNAGYAYYFKGNNEAGFSNYILVEGNYLLHGLGLDIIVGQSNNLTAISTNVSSFGATIGTGYQFRKKNHERSIVTSTISGRAVELKVTYPFTSLPEKIGTSTYSGPYAGPITSYMKLMPIATLSFHIIMP